MSQTSRTYVKCLIPVVAVMLVACLSSPVPSNVPATMLPNTPTVDAGLALADNYSQIQTPLASTPASVPVPLLSDCGPGLLAFAGALHRARESVRGIFVACSDGSAIQQVLDLPGYAWSIGNAVALPDRKIVFVRLQETEQRAPYDSSMSRLEELDLTTAQVSPILMLDGAVMALTASPDGRYLGLVLMKNSLYHIETLDVQNKVLSEVVRPEDISTEYPSSIYDLAWSPDGTSIVFHVSLVGRQRTFEYAYRADLRCDDATKACKGRAPHMLAWETNATERLSWTPTSFGIVRGYYTREKPGFIEIRRPDGYLLKLIDLSKLSPPSNIAISSTPVMSPQEDRIAYLREDSSSQHHIVVLNLSDMSQVEIPGDGSWAQDLYATNISWLPTK